MLKIENFQYDNKTYAVIMRANYSADGISFITDGSNSLEVGYMNHPLGHQIAPHRHVPHKRTIDITQEVIFLKSGRLRIDFYADDNTLIGSTELYAGDWILLIAGGHGFEMLEHCELVEIKNGPYVGIKDKERF